MIQMTHTIADSLSKIIASTNAFNINRGYLDKMVCTQAFLTLKVFSKTKSKYCYLYFCMARLSLTKYGFLVR